MKILLQLILMTSLCLLGSQVFANNHNGSNNSYKKYSNSHSGKQPQKQYNFRWSQNSGKQNGGWYASNNRGGHHGSGNGGGWHHGRQTHAVPELDANVAPLAGLLLSGLLAAGYERRRRKQLKTLKN